MHNINKILDQNEKKKKCDKSCNNYIFDHRNVACCLSDVYSVEKGALCAIHTDLKIKFKNA